MSGVPHRWVPVAYIIKQVGFTSVPCIHIFLSNNQIPSQQWRFAVCLQHCLSLWLYTDRPLFAYLLLLFSHLYVSLHFRSRWFFISVVYFVVFELFILSLENISFICLRLMANLCRNSVHDYFRFPNSPFFLISTCTWPRMDTIIFCYSPNSPFFRISTFTWPWLDTIIFCCFPNSLFFYISAFLFVGIGTIISFCFTNSPFFCISFYCG